MDILIFVIFNNFQGDFVLVSLYLFLKKKKKESFSKKEIFKILHTHLKGLTILLMETMSYLLGALRRGNTREARPRKRQLEGFPSQQHQRSASGTTDVLHRVTINSLEPEPGISGSLITQISL